MLATLEDHRADIEALCRRHHVRRLDLFGSAARQIDFTDDSDIDLLVEFDPDHSPPTFGDFLAFRQTLAALVGREIDLTMARAVRNPFVRAAIERTRRPLHGA
ncbi:MAG: nucleotidyltransferase family protein [Caulobacteraceae bacterium]